MNFLDAAHQVLSEAKQPLHYIAITQRALAAGLLDTKGQTPEASMGSRLYVETKRPGSRFRRVSRGVFALSEPPPDGIAQRIEALNRQIRTDLRQRLAQMPPDRFEALVAELLLALGFDEETIQVTSYGGDGGVDVRGVLNAAGLTQFNAAVQAKRWKGNVHAPTVQALRGSLTVHEQGILITTGKFSSGAITEAKASGRAPISLVDGETLLTMLIDHRIGVTAEQHTVYALDEEWWGAVAGEPDAPVEVTPPASPVAAWPLPIRATTKQGGFAAELLDASGRVRYNGADYGSPSGAGQAATGWKSCNGWTLWRYYDAATDEWRGIGELREK